MKYVLFFNNFQWKTIMYIFLVDKKVNGKTICVQDSFWIYVAVYDIRSFS